MQKTLETRYIWKAIRNIKQGYTPKLYSRTDKQGRHIKLTDIAEDSAKHLAQNQWGETGDEDWKSLPTHKIIDEPLQFQSGKITPSEIHEVLSKLKRNNAPGPDEIPLEAFKELEN